jgi:hypothetical protein
MAMWESNANELARALPRDLVGKLAVVHRSSSARTFGLRSRAVT